VQHAAMLDQVKPGDKVKFEAQKIGSNVPFYVQRRLLNKA